ncbi:McrB family protein [Herbaspirillum huttiense]|uniref:McrB family protein n=1 Tax=Herbaspirillum huttiense TaxID=863372 RepID=UPI0038061856
MPSYLTSARLRHSVATLGQTRAKAALMDFLIVKRTLAIAGATHVAITQNQPPYLQATKELAGVKLDNTIVIEDEKQIFNVFASHDSFAGFRRGKYISNGTGSTIGGNPWQTVLELTSDDPRRAGLRAGHEEHLEALLLKAARVASPNLGELAIWNYRKVDIAPIIAGCTTAAERFQAVQDRFVRDYQLNPAEIAALFENAPGTIEAADLQEYPCEPKDYLVGLTPPPVAALAVAAPTGKLCSLDLVVALSAKPFVILSGASGTGKSRATLSLAEQIQIHYDAQVKGQIFQLVPIGPDWTSPKKLLGFRTPFGQQRERPDGSQTNESYEITETVRIILRACNPSSTSIPHFLVFDEMNLSHVERYFAPFLSLMEASSILEDAESAPIIDKHSVAVISELLDLEDASTAEAESARLLVANNQPLKLPPNLFYVGTVNIDETTYMFSPKVLDRAHVLEVKALSPSEYVNGIAATAEIDLTQADQLLREAIDEREDGDLRSASPTAILDFLTTKHGVSAAEVDDAKALTLRALDGCFKLLKPAGFEFGYRVVKEVHAYMHVWIKSQLSKGATPTEAMTTWIDGLDRALFQKVLPKIHGNRSALGDSLKALHAFLGGNHADSEPPAKYAIGSETATRIEPIEALSIPAGKEFMLSRQKLQDMHARLVSRNYVSFVR